MELPKYYESKHVFVTIAVIIAISIPFSVAFLPFIIADIMFASKGSWFIHIPRNSYFLYGAGFILWLLQPLF